MSSPTRPQPPAWHGRLAKQLARIERDNGFAADCRKGWAFEPLEVLDMAEPIVLVLDGDEDTEPDERVPARQQEAVTTAVHYTLALYAFHQQSKNRPMHRHGISLGHAAQMLQTEMPSKDGAHDRFRAAHGADLVEELIEHLRGFTSLLHSYGIPLDYVALAEALVAWPNEKRRSGLRRSWGMDFKRRLTPKTPDTDADTISTKD